MTNIRCGDSEMNPNVIDSIERGILEEPRRQELDFPISCERYGKRDT
jgi:hypothetical protein